MEERNYGIDFLKIVSMFMIVILHTLNHGGLLSNVEPLSSNYWVAWFMETSAYCAVNCYALISGYLMYNSKTKLSRILELWIEVIFYSIIIGFILMLIYPDLINVKSFGKILFPITTGQYWYLSSYFGMYIFIPILNLAINNLDKKSLQKILLSTLIMMSLLSTLLMSDSYLLNSGYSMAWLSILYLTGGYIHKYSILNKLKKSFSLILFIMSIIITFLSKVILEYLTKYLLGKPMSGNLLISYLSPTIIFASIFLLSFFIKLNCNKYKNIIRIFVPASLSVYIIHDNPFFREKIMAGLSSNFSNSNCIFMMFQVLCCALIIYILCSLIDLVRIKLFKIIKINTLCLKIQNKFHL